MAHDKILILDILILSLKFIVNRCCRGKLGGGLFSHWLFHCHGQIDLDSKTLFGLGFEEVFGVMSGKR